MQSIAEYWWQKALPQHDKDVIIIPIYKNKGDHRDYGNHCGIFLLSIANKDLHKRLFKFAKRVLTRQKESIIDMIVLGRSRRRRLFVSRVVCSLHIIQKGIQ